MYQLVTYTYIIESEERADFFRDLIMKLCNDVEDPQMQTEEADGVEAQPDHIVDVQVEISGKDSVEPELKGVGYCDHNEKDHPMSHF
jgi:hypothetical protein